LYFVQYRCLTGVCLRDKRSCVFCAFFVHTSLGFNKINWVIAILLCRNHFSMYYFCIPIRNSNHHSCGVSHLLFGVQFYTILESNKKLIFKNYFFTIDYIVTFPCLLTLKMSKLAAQDRFLDLSD
jgi:hypothetical protein